MVNAEPKIQTPEVLTVFLEFVDWLRSRPGVKVELQRGEGLGAEFAFQHSAFGWEELAQFYRACDGLEFAWSLNRRPKGAFSMAPYVPIVAPPEGGYDDLDDDPNPAAHIGLEDPEGKFVLDSDEPILLCAGGVGLYDGDYVVGWCDTLANAIAVGIRLLFVRGWKNELSNETATEEGDFEERADALWAKLGPPPARIAAFLAQHVGAPLPFPAFQPSPLSRLRAFVLAHLRSPALSSTPNQNAAMSFKRHPRFDRDRARGCLLGLAVGDALGTTLEFEKLDAPAFPRMATGPHVGVTGGGPFTLLPGQVTDDTEMACCLAESLREKGDLDVADVARRYIEWSRHAFDVGMQISQVLEATASGKQGASREFWLARDKRPAANGSLMRTAPIGVAFAGCDDLRLAKASIAESAITHYDPRCSLACAALNGAIAAALAGDKERDLFQLRQAAYLAGSNALLCLLGQLVPQEAWPEVANLATLGSGSESANKAILEPWPEVASLASAADAINSDIAASTANDPGLYGPELFLNRADGAGFVRVALRLAFWELFHAKTFEAGLIDVVNRGGDADTNGAIAGALLGAFHGEAAIPARWREPVLAAEPARPHPSRKNLRASRLVEFADFIASGEPAAEGMSDE
jgi:ADP-ribosylglycohydrolase